MSALQTIKSLDECKLEGVTLSWEKIDGQVRSVTLTDQSGNIVKMSKANTYSDAIAVLVPAPPVMEDRWVLSGELPGSIFIRKAFKHQYEADEAKAALNGSGDGLKVEKLKMPVDDAGKAEFDEPAEIPF